MAEDSGVPYCESSGAEPARLSAQPVFFWEGLIDQEEEL